MLCDRSKFHQGVADKHVFLVMTRCQPASGLGAQTSAVFCPRTTVKTVMTGAALVVKTFCYKQVVAGLPKVLAEREHRGEDEERDVPSASCEFSAKLTPAPSSACSSCRFFEAEPLQERVCLPSQIHKGGIWGWSCRSDLKSNF